MAGAFATSYETEINLKLPELYHTAHISVPCHVTKQNSNYDIIFGRDILRELKIILDFNQNTVQREEIIIPMKPRDCTHETHFAISDSKTRGSGNT